MKYLVLLLIPVLCFAQYNIDMGGTGGNNVGAFSVGYTYVDLTNPANYTGLIDSITIKTPVAATADTFWIATGTWDGTTWTPRATSYVILTGSVEAVVSGALATPIAVVTGDLIAGYSNATNAVRSKRSTDGSGLGVKLKSGNYMATTFTAPSSLANEQTYMYATGYTATITAPTGLNPADTETGVSPTPTLSWNAQGDADSFYVKLSKSADLSSAIVDTAIKSNSLAVSLDYITQYYWGVAAKMPYDTTWSDTISFTTKKLATPTNRVPIADAVYVDSATTFSWAANAEADSFYLQIGDSALASLVLDTAIVANSLLYALVNDSSYWWSVAAKNSLDTSAWADTTKFTTGRRSLSEVNKRPGFSGWTHR